MKRLLGELLIEDEEISEAQLNKALEVQKSDGDMLGAILVNLGFLDEEILLEYLKKQGTHVKMHENKNIY